jgi:hypothetical protein
LVSQDGVGEPAHRLGCRLAGQGRADHQISQAGFPERLSGQVAALDYPSV